MLTTGLTRWTLSPPLPPGPNIPNPSRWSVGMKIGTTTASTTATPPTLAAVPRLAPVLTPNPVGSALPLPSGRPHRATCADSCRKIISRKPAAPTRNTIADTPLPMTLIGTQ